MKICTILCGLPGSGKTTWAKRNASFGCVIINRDAIRSMIYGEYRYVVDDESMILDMAFSAATCAINCDRDIIIDETGANPTTRKSWIEHFKKFRYEVRCVYFTTPAEECIRRRKIEDKGYSQDWAKVILGMKDRWVAPKIEEGYDRLTTI